MPPKRAAPSSSSSATDFTKWTLANPKAECKQKGLDTSGRKSDLVKRLQDEESGGSGGKMVKIEDPEDEIDESKMSMKEKLQAIAEKEKQNKTKRFKVSHNRIWSKNLDDFGPYVLQNIFRNEI